jgi:exodeoxyribonuclease VII large subunit
LARAAQAQGRLRRALQTAISQRRARLGAAAQFLNAVSYRNVLGRGFALVRGDDGAPLHNAAAVGAGQTIRIEFADGEIGAVASGQGAPAARPAKASKRGSPSDQGSLF